MLTFLLRTFAFCSSFHVILLGLCQLLRIPIVHIIDNMLPFTYTFTFGRRACCPAPRSC